MMLRCGLTAMLLCGMPHTGSAEQAALVRKFTQQYCVDCHRRADNKGALAFDAIDSWEVGDQPAVWEKVQRKLVARQMPPLEAARPQESEYAAIVTALETALDSAAAKNPNPGRTATFRRLTRTEYGNAIRDLLDVEIDAAALLPTDESSHGFDNITIVDLSPTLLDRYITAAQKISQLAVGLSRRTPGGDTIRLPGDLTQEEHVAGLPPGTRGGALIPYTFPQDGEYELQFRLARDRNEQVEGLNGSHELEVLLDRRRVATFTVKPPAGRQDHQAVDEHLHVRVKVTAGPHQLGVTFLKNPSSLLETKRQPYQAHYNMHRHPRISPALYQVSITGPHSSQGAGATPSRQRLLVAQPARPEEEDACARRVLGTLARRAYRRPVTESDLSKPLELYRQARAAGDFDAGIAMGVSAVLVNPNFLFRIELDPPSVAAGAMYPIGDLHLASRLSFFVWSSIPDDELLELAAAGELSRPEILQQQVRRMLADDRSRSLATNFADQWLHLRNLQSTTPDLRLFPDFDDNLRQALRQETELLFQSVVREDASVLNLLKPDGVYLNERLAKHYGVPHIYGARFRRVELDAAQGRGGLLRQGSILTVTSYATRTSPVLRGKWILENLLGTPPPPPPANVPALKDNTVSSALSVRQRLAEHRDHAACAVCHNTIDPVGFALENFDAVGRWRTLEEGDPVDSAGGLADGRKFAGVAGLEQALLDRPEMFIRALTEKLLTFALGRGVEHYDAPAIRQILRDAQAQDYRFSSLIAGIVASTPFTHRRAE